MDNQNNKQESGTAQEAIRIEARANAADYLRYARDSRRAAFWDRQIGMWPNSVSIQQDPGFVRARTARAIASAFLLEAETGVAHCHCHSEPYSACPAKSDNRSYWQRGKVSA